RAPLCCSFNRLILAGLRARDAVLRVQTAYEALDISDGLVRKGAVLAAEVDRQARQGVVREVAGGLVKLLRRYIERCRQARQGGNLRRLRFAGFDARQQTAVDAAERFELT